MGLYKIDRSGGVAGGGAKNRILGNYQIDELIINKTD